MEDEFEPRSRSLRNEALKERSGYDEDKDIDTTEHLRKDHESMHAEDSTMSRSDVATVGSRNPIKSADNQTESRPSIRCHEDDFDHDVIIIPDTPRYVFTIFNGSKIHLMAVLQSNSSLWIDDIHLSVNISLNLGNLCFKVLELALQSDYTRLQQFLVLKMHKTQNYVKWQ